MAPLELSHSGGPNGGGASDRAAELAIEAFEKLSAKGPRTRPAARPIRLVPTD